MSGSLRLESVGGAVDGSKATYKGFTSAALAAGMFFRKRLMRAFVNGAVGGS